MSAASLKSLILSAGFLAAVAAPAQAQDALAPYASPWLGINHGDMPVPNLITDLKTVGITMVREGFNSEPNDEFGAKVDAYFAAGIDPHVSVNMRGSGIDSPDYKTWLANYRQRCVDIMTAYKGKLHYYIVGNEPDKRDSFTGKLTAEQAVDFTRMAYEASREVDPSGGIKIESAPLSSPNPIKNYLKGMLAAGLTDCCDVVGIHAYSNQINDGKLASPWKLMREHGGTQKPIAISELGITTDWVPKGFTPEQTLQWKADFCDQAYVQAKRYGYANVILFESSSNGKWPRTFALLRDNSDARIKYDVTYNNLQENFKPAPLRDGDFESANDPKHQWVVYDDVADAKWDTSAYNFQAPGGHAGTCLQIDTSAPGPHIVRQVVSNVTPGVPLTISAWTYAGHVGGSSLKAEGYNAIAGDEETAAQASADNKWEQLSVTVTPTNPWVVIELSAAVEKNHLGGFVKFDDVTASAKEVSAKAGQ